MGLYNTLTTTLCCPRCGREVQTEIELYFGHRDMLRYQIGDLYAWRARKAVQNGGRPEGGDLDGKGYAECPHCEKDFFVIVKVREDRIVEAVPDPTRPGHIPD